MRRRRALWLAFAVVLAVGIVPRAHAARADCGALPNNPAKPAKQVAKEDVNVQNDYDKVVKEDTRAGAVYLALAHGATPKANKCGLKPKNDAASWTGWGGPVGDENVTIGEGVGTRNEIVIGGTYFERGVGTHAVATFVYDLTGADYKKFEGYVGMSDEKDPAECGAGGTSTFTFLVDGKEMFKSKQLSGTEGGANVPALKVEFDIPAGAKELTVQFGQPGDNIGCDHNALGDGKLLTSGALAVQASGKATTTWGSLKQR
jgi:hypothetical protein